MAVFWQQLVVCLQVFALSKANRKYAVICFLQASTFQLYERILLFFFLKWGCFLQFHYHFIDSINLSCILQSSEQRIWDIVRQLHRKHVCYIILNWTVQWSLCALFSLESIYILEIYLTKGDFKGLEKPQKDVMTVLSNFHTYLSISNMY